MRIDLAKYAKCLDPIERSQQEMCDRLISWCEINSGSDNHVGLATMLEVLQSDFGALEADLETIPINGGETNALHLTCIRQNSKFRILFSGHMDTVYGEKNPFQSCRFFDNGTKLGGPGVADMKGGLMVMLESLRALERYEFAENISWEVLISPDEETGSVGSAGLLSSAAERCDFGLVFEPSLEDRSLVRSRPGSATYDATAKGRASHVGRYYADGKNALDALCELSLELGSAVRSLSGGICNLGSIEGGGPVNVVPDSGRASFNIRVRRDQDVEIVENLLESLSQKMMEERGVEISWSGGFTRYPKEIGKETEAMFDAISQSAQALGEDLKWNDTGGCCDGNNLSAAGLPNIDTLGVDGAFLHSDREFMEVDSLVKNSKRTALFLMALADGALQLRF